MRRLTAGILNLNESPTTIQLLEQLGVLRDDGWAVDLIVVDNGSDAADTLALGRWLATHQGMFRTCTFVATHENLGAAGGRNIVLRLNRARRILILDNDVVLPESSDWLTRLWSHLDKDPELGLSCGMLLFADEPEIIQSAGIGLTARGRVGYLHRGDPVNTVTPSVEPVVAHPAACWLLRTAVVEDIGLLPEEYFPMQYWDVDYCVQMQRSGWGIVCDRGASVLHHANLTTSNLPDHDFARTAVKHGLVFREKFRAILPSLATLSEEEIYWGPIPRVPVPRVPAPWAEAPRATSPRPTAEDTPSETS